VKIWYDGEGDYLEVMFDQREGCFVQTNHAHVMKKIDAKGEVLGFSILKLSGFKGLVDVIL
jgi:hypothetical protein